MRFALRRRRLLRLIKAIQAQDKFDMGVWGFHFAVHRPSRQRNYCGTASCALGTAALVPEFREAGLDFRWTYSNSAWHGDIYLRDPKEPKNIVAWNRKAGQLFFGLSTDESLLFLQRHMPKPEVIHWLTLFAGKRCEWYELPRW